MAPHTSADHTTLWATPENVPTEWFTTPPHGFKPGDPIFVGPDGRFAAWSHEWRRTHNSKKGWRPTPSPTGNAMFHRGTAVTAEGTTLNVGTIPFGGGHSKAKNLVKATQDYDNPELQRVVARAVENETGTMILGAVTPGTTTRQVAEMRRSALSGDWRSIPELGGLMDYLNPCFVSVPGLPVGIEQNLDPEFWRIVTNNFETTTNTGGDIVHATSTPTAQLRPDLDLPQIDEMISQLQQRRAHVVQAMADPAAGSGTENHEDLTSIVERLGAAEAEIMRLSELLVRLDSRMQSADNMEVPDPDDTQAT